MSAKYIIFDGGTHGCIPVVFPKTFAWDCFYKVDEDSITFDIGGMHITSRGECYYTEERGWVCRALVADVGYIHAKSDSEILNRHLCN